MASAIDPAIPTLRPARVHEVTGPGAVAFALCQAAGLKGPVLWLTPDHWPEALFPAGVARLLPPGRLITATAPSEVELLWAAEEGLRSGAVGLVVARLERPLGLTAGRRLQLAAESGRVTGLMIVREGAGSPAAETRWTCTPEAAEDSTRMRWSRIKNKRGTCGEWQVSLHGTSHSVTVVSATGQRAVAAREGG